MALDTGLNPEELTTRFLGHYALTEGFVESIADLFLRPVPADIVKALELRRWQTERLTRFLRVLVERENLAFPNHMQEHAESYGAPPRETYDLVAEWIWASNVRTDLAHCTGRYAQPATDLPRWELLPRSDRLTVKVLKVPFTIAEFESHFGRLVVLNLAMGSLAAAIMSSTTAFLPTQ